MSTTSNIVRTKVLPVYGLEILPNGTIAAPGLSYTTTGGYVYFSYILTNTGNAQDDYALSAPDRTGEATGATFTPVDRAIHLDQNGNGVLDPGEEGLIGSVANVPAGGSIYVIVSYKIPATASEGQRAFTDLVGVSSGDPTQVDRDNVARTTITEDATLKLRKTANLVDVNINDPVTYTLTVTNTSGVDALGLDYTVDGAVQNGILIRDPLPTHATMTLEYVAGSLQGQPAGHKRLFSTDNGATWKSAATVGDEPAAATVTDVAYLFQAPVKPSQQIGMSFQFRATAITKQGSVRNTGYVEYATAKDPSLHSDLSLQDVNFLSTTVARIYIGPSGLPRQVGTEDNNDDGNVDTEDDETVAEGIDLGSDGVGSLVAPQAGDTQQARLEEPKSRGILSRLPNPFRRREARESAASAPPLIRETAGPTISTITPGSYVLIGNTVEFVHTIENATGADDVVNIEVDALSTLPATWTVTFTDGTGVIPLTDSNLDGKLDVGSIPAGATRQVVAKVLIPAAESPGNNGGLGWRLFIRVRSSNDLTLSDLTVDTIPQIASAQEVFRDFEKQQSVPAETAPGTTITYHNIFRNTSNQTLTNVVIIDELVVHLTDATAITTGTITDQNGSGTTIALTGTYNSATNTVVWQIPSVPAGFAGRLSFSAKIAADTKNGTEINNTFRMLSDQNAAAVVSNEVVFPVGRGTLLDVDKSPNVDAVSIGDPVLYTVVATNNTENPLTSISIIDRLPLGFRYVAGTGKIDGTKTEPTISADGRTLAWTATSIAGNGKLTITYVCIATPDAARGDGRNVATVAGTMPLGSRLSESALALVEVEEGPFENVTVIFGSVFVDRNDNRMRDRNETGLEGIRIYLEDGSFVITDPNGMYHFEGVKPGTHSLRLDQTTLPRGMELRIVDSQNAKNPASRFVRLRYGTPHKANFRVVPLEADTAGEDDVENMPIRITLPPDMEPLPGTQPAPATGAPADAPAGTSDTQGATTPAGTGVQAAGDGAAVTVAAPAEPADPYEASIESPADGAAFTSRGNISITVSGHVAAKLVLKVNGEEVGPEKIGKKAMRVEDRRVTLEYVSVPLRAGRNVVRLESTRPGQAMPTVTEITVMHAEVAARADVSVAPNPLMADGLTEPVLTVRLLDKNDVPAGHGTVVTLVTDRGSFVSRDLRPTEQGHQVQVLDGFAVVRMSPAAQTETRHVAVILGEERYELELVFKPYLRDWIVNGVVSGTVSDVSRSEAENDSRDWEWEDRMAVFAKGRLPWDLSLTASYDSAKGDDDSTIFREVDPLKYYPTYGDSSTIGYETESRDKLYLKLERDDSYIMYGDFNTDLDDVDLAAYRRSFTGAKTEVKTRYLDLAAFYALNDQAQVKAEIRGDGTSGYYRLPDADLVENSEEVTIEVRDRLHPDRVISSETRARFTGYDIDYDIGRILFKRPVLSQDRDNNPVFIVVRYEVDGRKSRDYATYGGRMALHTADRRLTLGGTYIVDEGAPENYTLSGVDTTLKLTEKLELRGEYAETDSPTEGRGQAHLIELSGDYGRTNFELYYRDIGERFDNTSMQGNTAGRRTIGLEGTFQITDELRAEDEIYTEKDRVAKRSRHVLIHDFIYEMERWELLIGGGMTRETGETEIDSKSAYFGRIGGAAPITDRLGVEAIHQQTLGDRGTDQPTRTELDLTYKLSDHQTLVLGGEVRQRSDSGSDLNLIAEIESQIDENATSFQRYTLENASDGRRVRSGSGLDLTFPVTPELRLGATGEISSTMRSSAEDSDDFVALTLSFEYTPIGEGYTTMGRYEVRDDDAQRKHLIELGGTYKFDDDHTLFGRNIVTYIHMKGDEDDQLTVDLLTGWAYRPDKDSLFVISALDVKYESGTETAAGADYSRLLWSTEVHYQPAARWHLAGKYAAKYTVADYADLSTFTDLKAGEVRYDFTDRLYGAVGARMLEQYDTGTRSLSYGGEVGYAIRRDMLIALGYNFDGFEDSDFSRAEHWEKGMYLGFHWKFDESVLGILNRLEGGSKNAE